MPGGSKPGGGLKSSPVYKMKGFSGFKSPIKFKFDGPKLNPKQRQNLAKKAKILKKFAKGQEILGKIGVTNAQEFLEKNTIKPKIEKPLSRPFGPGTRPLARNVSRGLKAFGRRIGVVGAITGVKDIFDGYGKMSKTKTGKRIIKDSRMQPGKI